MELQKVEKLATDIAQKNEFSIDKLLYKGHYYDHNNIRNLIYQGTYQGKPAALKVYNDERLTAEPICLEKFNQLNTSQVLIAPKLFTYESTSPQTGWFIMELLPEGKFFSTPLSIPDRQEFLNLYLIYRKSFPLKPFRELSLPEQLPTEEFHLFRINYWLKLAIDKEEANKFQGKKTFLELDKFLPLYVESLKSIRQEFKNRPMIWCHGHFKPQELYKTKNQQYYLTDFAHCKMYPEGYELAFIVWADYLVTTDWSMSYKQWSQGIFEWIKSLEKIAEELRINHYSSLIKVSIIERTLGTILADILASDFPDLKKEQGLNLMMNLIKDLL